MKRILVTGSRDWPRALEQIVHDELYSAWVELGKPDFLTIVEGACPTGVDLYAHEWAERWGHISERHPADWSIGKKAGPLRNQKMVDLGANICLAFIGPGSKGAKGCAKMAEKAGIKTDIYRMEY